MSLTACCPTTDVDDSLFLFSNVHAPIIVARPSHSTVAERTEDRRVTPVAGIGAERKNRVLKSEHERKSDLFDPDFDTVGP